jgi:hypothetical protein
MKNSNSRLIAIVIGLVALVWCVGVYTVSTFSSPTLEIAGSIAFGIIAAVISIVYLMFFWNTPGRQAVEVGGMSIFYTVLYYILALVLNTALALAQYGGLNLVVVSSNLVLTVLYLIIIIYSEKYTERVSEQLSYSEQALSSKTDISGKLGTLLSIVDDPELKKQIYSLKESVDYSSNVTTGRTAESEAKMSALLDELTDMIASDGDKTKIREKLNTAEITWKVRSSNA